MPNNMNLINLLNNGDFENGTQEWVKPAAVEYVAQGEGVNGSACVKITRLRNENALGIEHFFTGQSSEKYVLSFWVKGTPKMQIMYGYRYCNLENQWKAFTYSQMLEDGDEQGYRRFVVQFELPQDMIGTQASIIIRASSINIEVESGTAWIDEVALYNQDFNIDYGMSGQDYCGTQSFEKNGQCNRSYGVIVDPVNARSGYKVLHLKANASYAFSMQSDAPVGTAYMVSFFAKSMSANTRISLRWSYQDKDGIFVFTSAGITTALTSTYARYEFRIMIPASAQRVGNIYFSSTDSNTWIDDCKVVMTTPFLNGNYIKTNFNNVRVRSAATTEDTNYTEIGKGSMLLIEGYVTGAMHNGSNKWVKVKWGKRESNRIVPVSRYIHEYYVEEIRKTTTSPSSTVIDIAKSLVGTTGDGLGLAGEWCQTFLYWLCCAAGIDLNSSNIPSDRALVTDAISTMMNNTDISGVYPKYYSKDMCPSNIPYMSNWIYYLNVGSGDTASHVGLVVGRSGNTLTCIEGNLGSGSTAQRTIKLVSIPDYTDDVVTINGQDKEILGFAWVQYFE